jgi:DNA-binding response OmpR family regulator
VKQHVLHGLQQAEPALLLKTILSVHDDANAANSLVEQFKENYPSVRFFHTESTEETLAFFLDAATAGVLPELVVVDAHSLGERGLEILTKLRASESSWCIPVVVLLAERSSPDTKTHSLSRGVTRYVVDPRTPEGLANAVKSICALLGLHFMGRSVGA